MAFPLLQCAAQHPLDPVRLGAHGRARFRAEAAELAQDPRDAPFPAAQECYPDPLQGSGTTRVGDGILRLPFERPELIDERTGL